ncbi:DUF429 domain-containing protein [Vibrio chagasii]|nr:DUF429 domain-containing protein [Vibrio chagasii]
MFKVVKALDELASDFIGSTALIDMPIGFSDAHKLGSIVRQSSKAFSNQQLPDFFKTYFRFRVEKRFIKLIILRRVMLMCNAFGKKFSKQTWGIVPKIRELDKLIDDHPHLSIRVSPRVVFAAFERVPLTFLKANSEGKRRFSIILSNSPAMV